jgi:hypothetical protein
MPAQSYGFFCQPDGSFAIEGVLTGHYRLMLSLNSKNKTVDNISNMQQENLGRTMKDVVVGTENIDLGTIAIETPRAMETRQIQFY